MISLDDPKWRDLDGGYRVRYDASVDLKKLEAGEDVWEVFWNELHHQGDVGEASYAAVPHLVRIAESAPKRDWNLFGLVSIIEVERHRKGNPPVPSWLEADYNESLTKLLSLAFKELATSSDLMTIRSALAAVALAKGDLRLGAVLIHLCSSEIDELAEERLFWSELYSGK